MSTSPAPEDVEPRPRHASPGVLAAGGLAAVLLVIVGVLSLLSSTGPVTSTLVGTQFGAINEPAVDGAANVVVAPWASGHPAVVLFVGDWCTACHAELRTLGAQLGTGDLGAVRVIGIDSDASLGTARAFLAANHVRFPVAHDWLPVLTGRFAPADPETIVVSSSGRIISVHEGAVTLAQILADVASLPGS